MGADIGSSRATQVIGGMAWRSAADRRQRAASTGRPRTFPTITEPYAGYTASTFAEEFGPAASSCVPQLRCGLALRLLHGATDGRSCFFCFFFLYLLQGLGEMPCAGHGTRERAQGHSTS